MNNEAFKGTQGDIWLYIQCSCSLTLVTTQTAHLYTLHVMFFFFSFLQWNFLGRDHRLYILHYVTTHAGNLKMNQVGIWGIRGLEESNISISLLQNYIRHRILRAVAGRWSYSTFSFLHVMRGSFDILKGPM